MTAALAAARQFRGNPSLRCYTFCKALTDPAYRFVFEQISGSRLPLLDIGCGAGQLAAYLRARGFSAPIRGIDPDSKKIAAARRAFSGLPDCDFQEGDALALPPHSGNVVLLDVLHYFSPADRHRLFGEILRRLAPGGAAILRVTLRDASWRFAVTRLEEWFVRTSGWIPFAAHSFPSREELISYNNAVEIRPLWGATPFNSHALILRAPGSGRD